MGRCNLVKVPDVCRPEVFEALEESGREDELKRVMEMCYVSADHINQLIECFEHLLEELEKMAG